MGSIAAIQTKKFVLCFIRAVGQLKGTLHKKGTNHRNSTLWRCQISPCCCDDAAPLVHIVSDDAASLVHTVIQGCLSCCSAHVHCSHDASSLVHTVTQECKTQFAAIMETL
jgi:hypothetical protein